MLKYKNLLNLTELHLRMWQRGMVLQGKNKMSLLFSLRISKSTDTKDNQFVIDILEKNLTSVDHLFLFELYFASFLFLSQEKGLICTIFQLSFISKFLTKKI